MRDFIVKWMSSQFDFLEGHQESYYSSEIDAWVKWTHLPHIYHVFKANQVPWMIGWLDLAHGLPIANLW